MDTIVPPSHGDILDQEELITNDDNETTSSRFMGFTEHYESTFYPRVETKSAILLEAVYLLEAEHAALVAELFAQVPEPVQIPRDSLGPQGGSNIYIETVVVGKGDDTTTFTSGIEKLPTSLRPRVESREPSPTEDPNDANESPMSNKSKSDSSFTPNELNLLRRPLEFGWIRELVLQSKDGSQAGFVSYISPDGSLMRSYKDLTATLAQYPGEGLSRSNFSFQPLPVGGSKNEIIRKAESYVKWDNKTREFDTDLMNAEISNSTSSSVKRKRRAPPPSPQKNSLIASMEANDSEGGLFGISALSETLAGMDEQEAERQLKEYNQMVLKTGENLSPDCSPELSSDAISRKRDEVLPCSIRCPGVTGKIPELQCQRCLCLYHPECLGFSGDVEFTEFICSNCEELGSATISALASPPKDAFYDFMHRMAEMKKPMVTSAYNESPQNSIDSSLKAKRMDPSSISPPPLTKLRRFQVRIPIPQLTSNNLTITPLPIPKGQIPRVPNLSPIKCTGNGTSIPVFKRSKQGNCSTQIDSIQVNPQRQGNLSKYPIGAFYTTNYTGKLNKIFYPVPNFGASFGMVKQPTSNVFRNFPQSVVSVGTRKFIVIPRGPTPQELKIFEQGKTRRKCTEFGEQRNILMEVFKYLSVNDLVHASQVNTVWRSVASDPDLWKIVRLKNTRIFNSKSFSDFIASRNSETIDFRKALGTVDWLKLFEELSSIQTLRKLVLGSKAEELRPLAQQCCANIEILESLPEN